MNYDDFKAQWMGKGVDVDGYYGYQCYDLAHRYALDVVGKDIPSLASAKDLWNVPSIDGYDKIPNTPTGVPQKGDIVIWGGSSSLPYGHVAIFDSGDTNSFTSFDQNWPTGSLCHIQPHNYVGVLGWYHPKSTTQSVTLDRATFEKLVGKSTKYDDFVTAGFNSADDAKKAIQKLIDEKNAIDHDKQVLTDKLAKAKNLAGQIVSI